MNMVKKGKRKGSGKRFKPVSLARGGLLAASAVLPGAMIYDAKVKSGSTQIDAAARALQVYTGYSFADGTWTASELVKGWGPVMAVGAIDYGLSQLGVWRKIGSMLRF